jgi:hypothetical protein
LKILDGSPGPKKIPAQSFERELDVLDPILEKLAILKNAAEKIVVSLPAGRIGPVIRVMMIRSDAMQEGLPDIVYVRRM